MVQIITFEYSGGRSMHRRIASFFYNLKWIATRLPISPRRGDTSPDYQCRPIEETRHPITNVAPTRRHIISNLVAIHLNLLRQHASLVSPLIDGFVICTIQSIMHDDTKWCIMYDDIKLKDAKMDRQNLMLPPRLYPCDLSC